MFIMHISLALALAVLLASTFLIMWSMRNKGPGSFLGKSVGLVVLILSILSVGCIGYSANKYRTQGYFEKPMGMSMQKHHEMMGKMMPQMMENMGESGDQKAEEHASQHPQ